MSRPYNDRDTWELQTLEGKCVAKRRTKASALNDLRNLELCHCQKLNIVKVKGVLK